MIWLITRPVVWPAKVGFATGRIVGYRRITVFVLGVITGLLIAPMAGRELRALIQARMEGDLGLEPPPFPAETPIDLTVVPPPA